MGLEHLIHLPWGMKVVSIVKDVWTQLVLADFNDSIRGRPDQWTEKLIAEVYKLKLKGEGMIKTEDFTGSYFDGKRNVRIGWKLEQCTDKVDLLPLLQFLVPIFYPERQNRALLALASTIIASWKGIKVINWAKMLHVVITRQIAVMKTGSFTWISVYLSHLYAHKKCFTPSEFIEWKLHLAYLENGESDPHADSAPNSEDDSDEEKIEDSDQDTVILPRVSRSATKLISQVKLGNPGGIR